MSNAFDHVANSIQVAIGLLDSDPVIKTQSVSDAIEKLKAAKQEAMTASGTFATEIAVMKKQVADLEAHLAGKPVPAPVEEPAFKSDAKHPSKGTEIHKKK